VELVVVNLIQLKKKKDYAPYWQSSSKQLTSQMQSPVKSETTQAFDTNQAPYKDIQQEASSPQRKSAPDAFANPFVQAAFSPSKVNSFKSIAKQALLAQIRPALSPSKDKGSASSTKYRSSFTAMLLRRSTTSTKPDQTAAEAPVSPFKVEGQEPLTSMKHDETQPTASVAEAPSTEEIKGEEPAEVRVASASASAGNQDKQELEPEQSKQDDVMG